MSAATDTPRLSHREQLLGFVPYLIGFHPVASIVAVGLRDGLIAVGARADSDWPISELVRQLLQSMSASKSTSVILLGYGPPEVELTLRPVAKILQASGLDLHDLLRVDANRYFCLACTLDPTAPRPARRAPTHALGPGEEACHGPEGVEWDAEANVGAAIAVYHGMVAAPDRATVERSVAPIGGLSAIAMSQAIDRAEQRLSGLLGTDRHPHLPGPAGSDLHSLRSSGPAEVARAATSAEAALAALESSALGDASDPGGVTVLPEREKIIRAAGAEALEAAFEVARAGDRLDDDQAAWLLLLLHHGATRDLAWRRSNRHDWQRALWLDLTRRGEPALIAPVATLLAWVAWRRGEGLPARCALTRALAAEPTYSLAHLISDALDQGIPAHDLEPWPPTGRRRITRGRGAKKDAARGAVSRRSKQTRRRRHRGQGR